MVITVSLQHIYRFPVELVFKCYNEKYNDTNLKTHNIEKVENEEKKEDAGMECVTRTISFANFFPSIFQRIKSLQNKEISMEEECWSDSPNRRYWVRSHNLTWQDDATLAISAFMSPDEHNKHWTRWDQESFADFSSWGKLGTILELYMKRYIEIKMREEIKVLESAMSSMKQKS